jgi:dTDP-D-glucose 4,6-dehydratase
VYGENKGETFLEKTSTLDPSNPYSATKASAEMLVKAYQQSYSVPIIISRGNNVYGPRQYPEKVVPKFIHRAMRGMDMCIHGPGEQLRSYLHVDDVAAAFDTILHRGVTGEVGGRPSCCYFHFIVVVVVVVMSWQACPILFPSALKQRRRKGRSVF